MLRTVLLLFLLTSLVSAQNGDKKGEQQIPRVPREKIPPAPPLAPEAALKTFKLPEGYRIELVASEPMVETPVAMAFDPDGRMWVVEMRGFMPNPDGTGEHDIPGRVVVLEDTDGDGRPDKKTIFLDNLVMPRAIALVRDGVLVAEPPKLWFCRDTDGDGRSDEKVEVASDYGDPKNPEHCANGLLGAQDNWIYSLYHTYRYRRAGDKWLREPNPNRAQWGLAQDDFGRLFYTSNSDQLRGDLVPSHYSAKKAPGLKQPGLGAKIAADQTVWPGRVNPGVNRAYQPGTLREDGRLAKFTAACGTAIYRGDLFPKEFYGNAFVCEPSANLIRRNILTEKDGVVTAKNAYDKDEFLTSQDERFRPVNVYTGPDGALYVVDMYHGILQHRVYLTSYLREQALDRGLDKPLQQGRIYRIVPAGKTLSPQPKISKDKPAALVQHLSHPNGWWRDTAQRLLVDRGEVSVAPALQKLAATSGDALTRLRALWTLEGLNKIDAPILMAALNDPHGKVRAAAIRLSEPLLRVQHGQTEFTALRAKLLDAASDRDADVQIQLALTLGEIAPDTKVKETLAALAKTSGAALAREAAAFSIGSREPPKAKPTVAKGPPLTAEEQKRFEAGKAMYEATCLACHQPHGLGQEGLAPPLVGGEWVGMSPERLVRIVLHGMRGPVTVKKQVYELDMPALGVLDDEQIAAALTYIRREWGHQYAPVDPATVKKVREATATREDAWTEAELLKLP